MNVVVSGRNIDLSPALKEYLLDKLQRSQKHFDQTLQVSALLSVAKNPSVADSQTAEVTIKLNGSVIRGEESTENMYASIDLVADKIERQLRKYKTRYSHKGATTAREFTAVDERAELNEEDELEVIQIAKDVASDEVRPTIVRSKRFPLKPMLADEACKHMDLLGHDFFMFINSETSQVNTVYHRRDGNYGLIEPEV
ncbi:MAG: ribosome-associated translation inhibitor RaiA [Candidatus Obscuribacterales bacterium]|jgi:putative sigma-54 modulation protein|nr:ribosome-associated translation inhibitor RaiA [Candidatus Obscuribacterales bacterium]